MKLAKSSQDFKKSKEAKVWLKLEALLAEIENRDLTESLRTELKGIINSLNGHFPSDKEQVKAAQKAYHQLLKQLEKEMNLVAKNHHRTRWLALGMTVFGIPIGIALSSSLQNMSFIGIGLPIGLVVGIAVGSNLDQQAAKENRQLNIDL
jgi:hypothetical protein